MNEVKKPEQNLEREPEQKPETMREEQAAEAKAENKLESGITVRKHTVVQPIKVHKCCLDANKISEIQNIAKGNRPEPETYMTMEQIDAHLDQFSDGGSFVMTRDQYELFVEGREKIGFPDNSQYMTSREYMDSIESKAQGNLSVYEKELGFDPGYFDDGGGMVRIDVYSPREHNARIPSGNEMGTNSHFTPGGYTDGGAPECVTNNIPNDDKHRSVTFF